MPTDKTFWCTATYVTSTEINLGFEKSVTISADVRSMFTNVLGILLVLATVQQTVDCLECRLCHDATRLTDCTTYQTCAYDEDCYTDEVITETGRIIFNAGCRSRDVCDDTVRKRDVAVEKRQSGGLVACSECCNVARNTTTTNRECNTQLCGLQSTVSGTNNECYECDHVHDFNSCDKLTVCQQDQVCGTQTFAYGGILNGQHYYNMGCFDRRICLYGTRKILTYNVTGELSPSSDFGIVGKRDFSYLLTCQACCGDGLCNKRPCHKLIEKLAYLQKTGHLDSATLTYVP